MSNNEISIVTAFFDIGRGDWTPDKGLPHYLHRTTDTYMERFGYLAKLENEMVVYTSLDLAERVLELRGDRKTQVVTVDFATTTPELRTKIQTIQKDPKFFTKINPREVRNPEYWSADYVLVNFLKSHFVVDAFERGHINNDVAAWMDFGYCRTPETLNGVKLWKYPFNPSKMHLFNYRDPSKADDIIQVTINNVVYILGAKIIGGRHCWFTLRDRMNEALQLMMNVGFVDDDQTLLLMSCKMQPDMFELHQLDESNPFTVFRDFNEA